MRYGNGYWNIKELLPYQRNFNFVNSVRSQGKSYTTCGFFIERFLKKGEQFLFVVRNANEKQAGAMKKWSEKILMNEFPDLEVEITSETMYMKEGKKKTDWIPMGHCRALSEALKIKKQSFPLVKWMCMDEYMLEPKNFSMYVNGWYEPDLLLNLYHTVDREEDRVVVFMLGNNTTFYNPYHLHPAFQIPKVEPGKIWKSENVLFQNYEASDTLKEKAKKNKFLRMIQGTEYSDYAQEGNYHDNEEFISERPRGATYSWTLCCGSDCFGVWCYGRNRTVYISDIYNPTGFKFRVDGLAVEGQLPIPDSLRKWLAMQYGFNKVYFENMKVKLLCEPVILNKVCRR